MSAVCVDQNYIRDLSSGRPVSPVSSKPFFNALGATYGKNKMFRAVELLLGQDERKFSGVKEFKTRLNVAIYGDNSLVQPDDQKYLDDVVKRVSLGQLK